MSESNAARAPVDLQEWSAVAARAAADALGTVLGLQVTAGAVRPIGSGSERADRVWSTAVVFAADGVVSGRVALLLHHAVQQKLATLVPANESGEAVESALRELGNIVASRTVSEIADRMGGTILLSVPTLITENAARAVERLADDPCAELGFEAMLFGADGQPVGGIVFVPEKPPPDA